MGPPYLVVLKKFYILFGSSSSYNVYFPTGVDNSFGEERKEFWHGVDDTVEIQPHFELRTVLF